MNLVNANLTSISDLAAKLEQGQVMYIEDYIVTFDPNRSSRTSPFVATHPTGGVYILGDLWFRFAEMEVEVAAAGGSS